MNNLVTASVVTLEEQYQLKIYWKVSEFVKTTLFRDWNTNKRLIVFKLNNIMTFIADTLFVDN